MKFVSLLLTVLLLLSLAVPAFAVQTETCEIPVIHMYGQGTPIVNPKGEFVYTGLEPEIDFVGIVKDLAPEFIEAWKLSPDDAWDLYYRRVRDVVLPIFGAYALDKNGEASDGTRIAWSWQGGALPDRKGPDGYAMHDYDLLPDWRLDPFANADTLHAYIQAVKEATGSDKVNICGRCEAANVLLAYFAKYGYDDLNCVEFLASAARGVDAVSALFSGRLSIDPDALVRYREQNIDIENDLVRELVEALTVLSGDTYLLELAGVSLDIFNLVFVNQKILAPLIRETYGTMPGIWCMVDKEDYPAALRNIFGGHEEEYAGLIEKLDHYDRVVRQHADELLLEAKNAGVKVAVFAKYNDLQTAPIGKYTKTLGDGSVNLTDASFGATTAPYGETLSASYLQAAAQNGTANYISPDKMVDASTCVLPDTTWFIWGSGHLDFSNYIFDYLMRFLALNGEVTVFDDPDYPQYAVAQPDASNPRGGTIVPMAAENTPTVELPQRDGQKLNWKETVFRLLKAALNFFVRMLLEKI